MFTKLVLNQKKTGSPPLKSRVWRNGVGNFSTAIEIKLEIFDEDKKKLHEFISKSYTLSRLFCSSISYINFKSSDTAPRSSKHCQVLETAIPVFLNQLLPHFDVSLRPE